MKRITSILVCLAFLGLSVYGQDIQITGKVTSADDGSALPGVSVVIKGTQQGVSTNVDGNYSITAPSDATLVFTFVGMEDQEVQVGGQTTIDVQLTSGLVEVEEVVVVALGMRKDVKALGYSVTQVESDEITKAGSSSALNALRGKVAGVDISSGSGAPGASTRVFIRGYSSISRSNQPLYVIDGVPVDNYSFVDNDLNGGLDFGNKLNDINPDDIESISVLKGSAASVQYGSRGANGVIMITTKNGVGADHLTVNYSGSYTWDTPLMLPQFQNEYGQGFFGEPDLIENTSWGPRMNGEVYQWGRVVNNSQQVKPYVAQPDNVKDFFDAGVTQKHSISVSNGNETTGYYISYGYVGSDGIFPTDADSYKRHTIALRGNTKVNKFDISTSLNYVKKKSKFVPTGQDMSVYDNIMQVPRDMSIVDGEDYNDIFWDLDGYYSGYTLNPYYVLNENGNEANEDRLYGQLVTDYDFTDWLKAKWNAGGEVSNLQIDEWRAITNVSHNDYNDDPGRVIQTQIHRYQVNSELLLMAEKIFNDFYVGGYVGYNVFSRLHKGSSQSVTGLDIPEFYHISNSSSTPVVAYAETPYRTMGVYANLDLEYREMVFLSLSARNDWSSTLPKDNNSYFYPGANLSFVFTELVPSNNILTFGKIRGGISQTGNDAPTFRTDNYYLAAYHRDGYRDLTYPLPGNINGFEVSNSIGNAELQPEITTEWELGTDLRFFNGRLYIDFSYFDKNTDKNILDVELAPSGGYTVVTSNVGKITSEGMELAVSGTPVKTSAITWNIGLNFTKIDNKVTDLGGRERMDIGGTGSLGFVLVPGEEIGLFYGEAPSYDDQGRIIVGSDGLPVADDEYQILGCSATDWSGGISNSVSYKGLTFSFSFETKQGGLMYSRTAEIQYFAGTAPLTLYNDRQPFIIPNSVTEGGTDGEGNPIYVENTNPVTNYDNLYTYWGQSYGGGLFNRRFMVDRSFVKLREVVLSYQLPSSLLQNIFIKEAQISLIGRNLLIWTHKDNTFIDPETTTFGGNDSVSDTEYLYGEFSSQPSTRSFGFALNLTF
ncbi:MAG: SusC/RagA family TonB-linked outer membrane protein [Bacteroidales bacterium]|nr:SusC/RagA family TonB-linked outer membrane protein [Bacteroidales bacterium]